MALVELVDRFSLGGDPADVAVSGISLGTGAVRPGHLFIALQGVRSHGADYAADAVARGAVAVLTDPDHAELDLGVPVDTESITASFESGILRVAVPKRPAHPARAVPVTEEL